MYVKVWTCMNMYVANFLCFLSLVFRMIISVTCWKSYLCLVGVTSAKLWWHLSSMNVQDWKNPHNRISKQSFLNPLLLVLNVGATMTLSSEFAFSWMPQITFDDKAALIQLMAWCQQTPSHSSSQFWMRSVYYPASIPSLSRHWNSFENWVS